MTSKELKRQAELGVPLTASAMALLALELERYETALAEIALGDRAMAAMRAFPLIAVPSNPVTEFQQALAPNR